MEFRAKIIHSGNATAVEVPKELVQALEGGARPLIAVTINGHSWRTRIALMRGQCLVGISAENRSAARIAEGDIVDVFLKLDSEPRVVELPKDLIKALQSDLQTRAAFDRLPYGLKRKHVAAIEDAKSPEVRERRIAKLVAALGAQSQ